MTNKLKPNKKQCDHFTQNKAFKIATYTIVGCILVLVAVASFIVNPFHLVAKHLTRISMGSELYNLLKQEDMPGAHVHAYVFNITNAHAFTTGQDSKLKLEEVGPFVYQEYRTNANLELDEEEGIIRYHPKMHAKLLPEESIAHPQDVNLTVPNVAMLSITSLISSYPYWTRLAYTMMVNRLNSSSIINIDADSFLWGYDEPIISMAHTLLPGWITFKRMGLLDRLYDAGDARFELGATDKDKLLVKSYNDEKGIPPLGYPTRKSRCNTFEDTYEGIIYPPDLAKETPLRVFRNAFCRILDLEYLDAKTLDYGPEVFRYRFSNTSFSNTPENDCLCTRQECVEGITDLSPCFFGLGLALSNAHFLYGDPKIYERIEGMAPNEEDHGSEFLVDSNIGAVLDTRFTLQVSLVLNDIGFVPTAKPFSNMIIPVAYFKILQPELPEETKNKFWALYVLAPTIQHSIEAILFVVGLALLALAAKLYYSTFEQNGGHIILTQVEPLVDKEFSQINIEKDLSRERSETR